MLKNLIRSAMLAMVIAAAAAQAQDRMDKTAAEVAEMLEKHDNAMNNHDLDGVMALFVPGSNTVIIGPGPGEKFQGWGEIRTAYLEFFKGFDQGTLRHNCYWKNAGGSGNVAWGAVMCKFADSRGDKRREYERNISTVMEKRGDNWRFIMLHYSKLVGASPPNK